MIKVLFFIHDMGNGGAEKVLVNLVNGLNKEKFDVTLISLFGGKNEKKLSNRVHYKRIFRNVIRGNTIIMKLFSPKLLHRLFIGKNFYDIEVSYLEGDSARIISGCTNSNTRLVSWIHTLHNSESEFAHSFRNYKEAKKSYERFDKFICVSNGIRQNFNKYINKEDKTDVIYNPIDLEKIRKLSIEPLTEDFKSDCFNIVSVGTLKPIKGYTQLLNVVDMLVNEKYNIHLYLLGDGPQKQELLSLTMKLGIPVTFLGFQDNPYKYVSKANLYVCSSFVEGLSTAVIESLAVGTPVCTTDVPGMREILGDNNCGIVVQNNSDKLFEGIKYMINNKQKYTNVFENAEKCISKFSFNNVFFDIEGMLFELFESNLSI